ncbi:polyprenyl diphosphate synthase [Hydromonas duriensis]|uniref:Isoprenyl transferase n=1 Tax=Hydromonas duriensis TaxID=1527608 RepID=A0A4R6Y8G1_9BURK|nr:polyprenyl diphosphate synthase [Hydromonas duriensis]TDR31686.1 undecaprenyl pyrophosphate synthetase [Hydromonas duriensis]
MSEHVSSTLTIPTVHNVPEHVAIIMDGNGRWATSRGLPRVWGHKRGAQTVREVVRICVEIGVKNLTLFAFSSENWRRPPAEVSFLMKLFMRSLRREIKALADNGIQLRIIGELSAFDETIQGLIKEAHEKTRGGKNLTLTVSANYGGRWDILNAMNALLAHRKANGLPLDAPVSEEDFQPFLQLADLPEPDLFIRTGGEARVSNFLLWQLAYTELYFTPTFWPDFNRETFLAAVGSYQQRERRFGRTSAQLKEAK